MTMSMSTQTALRKYYLNQVKTGRGGGMYISLN